MSPVDDNSHNSTNTAHPKRVVTLQQIDIRRYRLTPLFIFSSGRYLPYKTEALLALSCAFSLSLSLSLFPTLSIRLTHQD